MHTAYVLVEEKFLLGTASPPSNTVLVSMPFIYIAPLSKMYHGQNADVTVRALGIHLLTP